jgi:hypothetical protein
VGPIVVGLETVVPFTTQFPLYVEIVPLPGNGCKSPGYLVLQVFGVPDDCGGWTMSSPIDITRFVPIGSPYALRVHYFGNLEAFSPGLACVRVTPETEQSASGRAGWGHVKQLYR